MYIYSSGQSGGLSPHHRPGEEWCDRRTTGQLRPFSRLRPLNEVVSDRNVKLLLLDIRSSSKFAVTSCNCLAKCLAQCTTHMIGAHPLALIYPDNHLPLPHTSSHPYRYLVRPPTL